MVLSYSRFRNTSLILTKEGAETYGLMEGFNALKNMTGDQYFEWPTDNALAGRPDLIAHKFYNLSHYEWVIVFANHPRNPLNWPKSGEVIKIPKIEFVRTLI